MSAPEYTRVPLDIDDRLVELLGIKEEPGWTGPFSRKQFPGALPNGTRIRKARPQAGDAHEAGAMGTVLGSIQSWPGEPIVYFVEWDDSPRTAVFIVGNRIEPVP